MDEALDEAVTQWEALPGDCPVYRAALNWLAVDKVTGQFLRGAYLRREPLPDGTKRDVKGISVEVYRTEGYSDEQIVEAIIASKNKCRAVGRLIVGSIRAIPTTPLLDVVQDRQNHANITGLPEYGEDVPKAERLATALAKMTKRMWPNPEPNY